MFRPGTEYGGVLWLALGVIAMFAVPIAVGEAGSFLGRMTSKTVTLVVEVERNF
jgi:hypothetical protein